MKSTFGIKLGAVIVLLVLLVVLIVQNVTATTLRLFFWEFSSPVIAVVLVSLLAGFLIGLLTKSLGARREKPSRRPAPGESIQPQNPDNGRDRKKS